MRQVLPIHERKYPEGWQRFRCQSLLGAGLTGLKQYAEAEPFLLHGYQGMVDRKATIPIDGQKAITYAATYLAELYQSWGKPGKAAEWRSKVSADSPK